jgi:hypothetical protein
MARRNPMVRDVGLLLRDKLADEFEVWVRYTPVIGLSCGAKMGTKHRMNRIVEILRAADYVVACNGQPGTEGEFIVDIKGRKAGTIDATPKWVDVLPLLIDPIVSGEGEARKTALEQLVRMAQLADEYVRLTKE